MTRRPLILAAMTSALCLGLAGCASTATRLPHISEADLRAESIMQETQTLAAQARHAARLVRVGRPILLANAELCPKTRRDIGVSMHTQDNYPKELRLAAGRELGAGEQPSIVRIAPDSPAARAGLRPGDRILIEDRPVDIRSLTKTLSKTTGPVTLDVQSQSGETQPVNLVPDTVCDYRLRLKPGAAINAYADGRNITISAGMMDFTRNDDELALVVGHELAHNTMGHIRKVIGNLLLSGFATRYTRIFESESDYVGLYYMVRAGFDPDGVEAVWRRLADVDPRSVNRAKTHPTFPDRFVRIRAARAEIEAKQAAGEPLLPNFKDDMPDA